MPEINESELKALREKVASLESRLRDLGSDEDENDRFRMLIVERDLARSLLETQAKHQSKVLEEAVQFYFAMSTMLNSFGKRLRKLTELVEVKDTVEDEIE